MINGTRFRVASQVADQQRLNQSIADLQNQIATGQRLTAPSDDPLAYARIATICRERADNVAAQSGIARAAALSSQADGSIASAQDYLDRANETLIAAASGTSSSQGRLIAAEALVGIAEDLRRLSTTRDSTGAQLFADTRGTNVPVGQDVIEAVPSRQSVFTLDNNGQSIDIADAIIAAADRLRLAAGDSTYTASADLALFETAATQLAIVRADVGYTGQRLEDLSTRLEARNVDLAIENSGLADTDVADAIGRITGQQTSLQAAQAMFARINQSGLFELLQ